MRPTLKVIKLRKIIRELQRRASRVEKNVEKALKRGALEIFKQAQTLVPVEFGPLKASGSVRVSGSGLKTKVTIVYTSEYAVYVHEIPPEPTEEGGRYATHGWMYNLKWAADIKAKRKTRRGPKQQYKFLETPFRELRPNIISEIKKEIRNGLVGKG